MDFTEYTFRLVDDVAAAHCLEAKSYPSSEAGSLASLAYRQRVAPDLFLGLYAPDFELRGFVCATASAEDSLTAASMEHHDPVGRYVLIHSVVVDPQYRRRGLASALLRAFHRHVADLPGTPYLRLLLIAHEPLFDLYQRAGYQLRGPSPVVHGPDAWFEFARDVTDDDLRLTLAPSRQ
ncbi:hypothetical protein IWQ60_003827 [Tieghemiomyces parasiticus]|uniref:N-acetyltransferase domain-containing protein n=1 Tax=Tieghemiomyces parasiticus TaxID=78921 RepID=A0A9W8AES9_9FUNG|nr:hypothetical protein IWQ60_003827 [Tieghemiomyces parasiticus]